MFPKRPRIAAHALCLSFSNLSTDELFAYVSSEECDCIAWISNETQEWEKPYTRSKSFDLDWIKHSICTLLREYEDGSFEFDHNEQWYNVHIWGLIDLFWEHKWC
jgi:hypothetical protein